MKREISLDKANRLLNIGGVVLITAKFGDRDNVTPVAWNVPVSKEPALVAVAIAPERFIYELIEKSKEFAINLPTLKTLQSAVNLTFRKISILGSDTIMKEEGR